ncbi:hypothetical protein NDA11_000276 [Ustilago hordei]|nr:hypothetical protein NDA12_007651 [Ustilago hordei]KAJ1589677.1 hypothetical protein NDA15_007807 [Ustilago hordei]KAJ1590527.1 hypothetical protein NDA11_000276 [Ustilago hordei]KAJ1600905.1 hypothetical protein NDA14_004893 [Ustilago hordei]
MDIYDPGLMGAAGRVDGTSTPTGTISNDGPKTELDQNVEKLVGNISNWWSGFAKKSQDSINQARKEVETRGGIVNYAKREYAKLESSIGEAQKKTRDQSQTPSQPQETSEEGEIGAATKVSESEEVPVRSETSKGKQRVVDDQVAPSSAEAGTVTNQGPTLGASVSSLFSKLTSDPRIAQLQQSLTDTLQTVATPQGQPLDKEGGDAEKKSGANLINIQESLSKLSFTIQSHLPHLDLKESQQLATRYLRATESFAREVQSDMKDFVGELVRIVPPEGEGAEKREVQASKAIDAEAKIVEAVDETPSATIAATKSAPKSSAAAKAGPTTTSATTVPSEDEEDFAWDEDDEEAAASVETKAVAAKEKEAIPAASTVAATDKDAKSVESKKEETDEDSDWE